MSEIFFGIFFFAAIAGWQPLSLQGKRNSFNGLVFICQYSFVCRALVDADAYCGT